MIDSDYSFLGRRSATSLEGERRLVTILFCDVKDSTAMAERLDPEEWAEIMNAAFEMLIRPVQRYGGTVARLMGDSILAFFGAPTAHEDDPQRAILAGLDILAGIQPFREQLQREYGLDFNVRVGVNTGPVVVAEVGTELAGEYTVMGDAVNLAARLEQAADPGSLLVSASTYRLVSPYFDFEPLGAVTARGRSDPVEAYRVLGRREQPQRGGAPHGLHAELVGRQGPVETLRAALEDLSQGRGGVLVLIGDAGLGKSRLLEELRAVSQEQYGERLPWLESRGVSYDSDRPYGLFLQHLSQAGSIRDDDPAEVVRARVAERFAGFEPQVRQAVSRAVEALLALRAGAQAAPLEGEALKREVFESALDLWRILGGLAPRVLVFDDLHWADPASVELLLHLFQLVDEAPLLFLCAMRPVRAAPGWQVKAIGERDFPHRYTEIVLAPLSGAESDELIDRLLPAVALPEGLRRMALDKAEGNPFFLEEVVRALIESGAIRRDESGQRWAAAGAQNEAGLEGEIPDSLQALLLARIDRLPPEARRTLQLASVVGRSFPFRVLQAISGAGTSLERQLADLERAGLVRQSALQPEREYAFRHELTREAAYQSILRRRRRQHHRAVGEAMERLFPERLEAEAHRLAGHFLEARDEGRALRYFVLAGNHAARLYANQEAIAHYRRAVEVSRRLETSSEALVELYTRLGRVLEFCGRYDEALEMYRELRAIGQARAEPAAELAAILPQATVHAIPSSAFSLQEGRLLSLEALGLARQLGDPRAETRALWNLLLIEVFDSRDLPLAVDYGQAALAIARQHNWKEDLAYVLHDIARPYLGLGRNEEAWQAIEEANRLWQELENLPMLADSLVSMAQALHVQGEFERAHQLANQGLALSQQIGSEWGQSFALSVLGTLHLEWGEIDQGIACLKESLALGERANFLAVQFGNRVILCWVYASLGAGAESESDWLHEDIERVAGLLGGKRDHLLVWEAFHAFHTGELERAEALLEQVSALTSQEELEMYYGPLVPTLRLEAALGRGRHERALELAEAALARLGSAGARLFLPDVLRAHGRALLALGRRQEAYHSLLEARREARRQNSRRSLLPVLLDLIPLSPEGVAPAPTEELEGPPPDLRQEARQVLDYVSAHLELPGLRQAFLGQPSLRNLFPGG